MSNDQNLVCFTGNLGRDPEITYTPSGFALASISIAVGGRKKRGDTWEDTTTWVPLKLLGRQAELANTYLQKGSKIRVSCEYQTREWKDKGTGKKRYGHEFLVNDLQFLGGIRSKTDGESNASNASGNELPDDGIPF